MDDYVDGLPDEQRAAFERVRAVVADVAPEALEGFDLSKGTIRFTPEQPVPEDVLTDVIRARMQELARA
jgi:uncharacterized protein YdhG (YjbR/CyaY superfamily)